MNKEREWLLEFLEDRGLEKDIVDMMIYLTKQTVTITPDVIMQKVEDLIVCHDVVSGEYDSFLVDKLHQYNQDMESEVACSRADEREAEENYE